jgi:type IV pilus assembly protein PilF
MRTLATLALAVFVALVSLLSVGCTTTTEVNGQPVSSSQGVPGVPEQDVRKRAEIRLQLAASYYQKGQFSIAYEEVQKALQVDSGYADAYGMLGLINMGLGKQGEADSNFQRALQLDGQNPEILNNYGWFLCQTGRERQSIDYFKRAAESQKYATPAMSMQNAGLCMLRLKDMKAAETYLKRSFELDAANPVTKYQLSRLYLNTGQIERARFYYGLLPHGQDAGVEVLWLGVRIAHADGDPRTEKQLASELLRRFPDSKEAASLRREAFDD